MVKRIVGCALRLSLVFVSGWLLGAEPLATSVVVATVGDEKIFAAEVEHEVTTALAAKKRGTADEVPSAEFRQAALQQVIDRHLVLQALRSSEKGATPDEMRLAQVELEKDLARQNIKLADFLKEQKLTVPQLQQKLTWELSWKKYLKLTVTDRALEAYFRKHPRDFDGTELKVAHLLLKVAADADAGIWTATSQQAAKLREEIATGKTSFAAAAQKHSQAPTAADGGEIGWITRHEPMPEVFSAAAFALEVGQTSEPVTTPLGVHLIHLIELKPGSKTWQDCRDELRPPVALYLFRWLADKERAGTKIEIVPSATSSAPPASK